MPVKSQDMKTNNKKIKFNVFNSLKIIHNVVAVLLSNINLKSKNKDVVPG